MEVPLIFEEVVKVIEQVAEVFKRFPDIYEEGLEAVQEVAWVIVAVKVLEQILGQEGDTFTFFWHICLYCKSSQTTKLSRS